jgi:hypothetical protein
MRFPRIRLSIHQRYTKSGVELRIYKAQKGIVEHRLAGYSENNIQTEIPIMHCCLEPSGLLRLFRSWINPSAIDLTDLILEHLVRRHFMLIPEFRSTLGARCWHTVLEPFSMCWHRSVGQCIWERQVLG